MLQTFSSFSKAQQSPNSASISSNLICHKSILKILRAFYLIIKTHTIIAVNLENTEKYKEENTMYSLHTIKKSKRKIICNLANLKCIIDSFLLSFPMNFYTADNMLYKKKNAVYIMLFFILCFFLSLQKLISPC